MTLCAQNEMSSEGSRRESPSLIASGAFSYSNHSGLTLHCVHRAGISSCNLRHRHHRLTLSFAGQLHTLYCSITLPDSSSARQHCRTTQDHAVHSRCKIVCGAGVSYHVTNTSCQAHHHSVRTVGVLGSPWWFESKEPPKLGESFVGPALPFTTALSINLQQIYNNQRSTLSFTLSLWIGYRNCNSSSAFTFKCSDHVFTKKKEGCPKGRDREGVSAGRSTMPYTEVEPRVSMRTGGSCDVPMAFPLVCPCP